MYVIREVLNCRPGKVRQMIEKFRSISAVLKEMGEEPLRLLTVSRASRSGPVREGGDRPHPVRLCR
jgi:hypothetical protein